MDLAFGGALTVAGKAAGNAVKAGLGTAAGQKLKKAVAGRFAAAAARAGRSLDDDVAITPTGSRVPVADTNAGMRAIDEAPNAGHMGTRAAEPPKVVKDDLGDTSGPQATPPLFSQTTASRTFRHGSFADQTVGDVADGLRAGKISPTELPVDVIVRNGETIGLNTRSMLALRRGGIDPSDWILNDATGVPGMERLLTERLLRNQLTGGTGVLRITGAGGNASSLL